jgi:hypothetical protein
VNVLGYVILGLVVGGICGALAVLYLGRRRR